MGEETVIFLILPLRFQSIVLRLILIYIFEILSNTISSSNFFRYRKIHNLLVFSGFYQLANLNEGSSAHLRADRFADVSSNSRIVYVDSRKYQQVLILYTFYLLSVSGSVNIILQILYSDDYISPINIAFQLLHFEFLEKN